MLRNQHKSNSYYEKNCILLMSDKILIYNICLYCWTIISSSLLCSPLSLLSTSNTIQTINHHLSSFHRRLYFHWHAFSLLGSWLTQTLHFRDSFCGLLYACFFSTNNGFGVSQLIKFFFHFEPALLISYLFVILRFFFTTPVVL